MAKHALKILRCSHRKIFNVWPFYNIMHERVKQTDISMTNPSSKLSFLASLLFQVQQGNTVLIQFLQLRLRPDITKSFLFIFYCMNKIKQ